MKHYLENTASVLKEVKSSPDDLSSAEAKNELLSLLLTSLAVLINSIAELFSMAAIGTPMNTLSQ